MTINPRSYTGTYCDSDDAKGSLVQVELHIELVAGRFRVDATATIKKGFKTTRDRPRLPAVLDEQFFVVPDNNAEKKALEILEQRLQNWLSYGYRLRNLKRLTGGWKDK